jgi:transposase-like protein
VTKRGIFKNKSGFNQCYGCKTCGIRFVTQTAFTGMQHRAPIVICAVDLYFKGVSLRNISNHLGEQFGITVTHQTIYRWILKYLSILKEQTKDFSPRVSRTWHADETVQNVSGKYRHQWNLIDGKTRFYLATMLSKHRDAKSAEALLELGLDATPVKPRTLISDGLLSYETAGRNLKQKRSVNLTHRSGAHIPENNRVERLNNTLRERTKTMRSFRDNGTTQEFLENYRLYYNYLRPHSSLGGLTPAEAAGYKTTRGFTSRWRRFIH